MSTESDSKLKALQALEAEEQPRRKAEGALIEDPVPVAQDELTIAELYAKGARPINEAMLVHLGMSVQQAVEVFGDDTVETLVKRIKISTMSTAMDKVITNPNLVQGVQTVVGAPGSVQNVKEALEASARKSSYLGQLASNAGFSEEDGFRPAAAQPGQAVLPKQEAVVVAPPTAIEELEAFYLWCASGDGTTMGRMNSRTFMIEKELSSMLDLMAGEYSRGGIKVNPSQLLRKYLRECLAADYKRLYIGDEKNDRPAT